MILGLKGQTQYHQGNDKDAAKESWWVRECPRRGWTKVSALIPKEDSKISRITRVCWNISWTRKLQLLRLASLCV